MIDGRPPSLSGTLRLRGLAAGVSPSLRAGQTLEVRVLRPLGQGRWAVVVRGKILSASASVKLTPGTAVTARVVRGGPSALLRLLEPAVDMRGALENAGLPVDAQSEAAARALLRAGLGVTAARLERLRAVAPGTEQGRGRRLRAAAEILKKLPSLGQRDLKLLVQLVMSGDEEEGDPGGDRERRRRRARARLPEHEAVRQGLWRIEETSRPPEAQEGSESALAVRRSGLLRLFNHLGGRGEAWVVLPCSFSVGPGVEVKGTVRMLVDTSTGAIRTVIVGAAAEGEQLWWFHLSARAEGMDCRVLCDGPPPERAMAELSSLRAQLGNLGVRVADTVGDGAQFDGFAVTGPEDPRPLDLLALAVFCLPRQRENPAV